MDIFQSLPSLKADEADAADQPKQTGPRNGPVRYRDVSNGQAKRARQRAAIKQSRRQYRKQVRAFLSTEREVALLRSSLQAIGVLSYVTDLQPTEQQVALAMRNLVSRYGSGTVVTEESLRAAVEVAVARYRTLTGQPA